MFKFAKPAMKPNFSVFALNLELILTINQRGSPDKIAVMGFKI